MSTAVENRPPRLVALGESMLRLSTHDALERTDSLDLHVAGSESNVAVALAQLGWSASWISALPRSPLGRRVARELQAYGIDLSGVRWVEGGRVGVFFVELGRAPRTTAVWYDRAGSAAARLEPDDLDLAVLEGADYAVVSGITAGIGEGARALALRFASEARALGAKVCVDVNFRARLWSAEEAAPAIAGLLALADIVVCSAHDAAALWGITDSPTEAVQQLRTLHAAGAELVVLTCGSDGAIASVREGGVVSQPACPASNVDEIGAGDAFVAGLLWGLEERDPGIEERNTGLDERTTGEALRAGTIAAALKCTMSGDHLLVTRDELLRQLDADRQHADRQHADRQHRVVR